jgi:ankyrin repeat protein
MGWPLYLTAPSHILRRVSGYTIWTNPGAISEAPPVGSPLYYAGFYDLAERLIMKHPEQVNLAGGLILAPLPAALSKRHFHIADLLSKHGAVVDVRDKREWIPLHVTAQILQSFDITRWLLKYGANASAQTHFRRKSLHRAAFYANLEAVQVLLEYNPDIGLRDKDGDTPFHDILTKISPSPEGNVVEIVRRLLEYGVDPNIRPRSGSTSLHRASSRGSLGVARLLLSHGANVDEHLRTTIVGPHSKSPRQTN